MHAMGIGRHVVEALIRESQHKPIKGDVILIGRQTVYFTPEAILDLLKEHGVDTKHLKPSELETGGGSTVNLPGYNGTKLITDSELFRLIGVPKILALDHSDYEGAEIIHNLTTPVPPNLEGCADFIVDGSTLDNVFDPAMVLRNFAKMLKPGGRLITTNMYSNFYEPYVILPPLWYFDYFTVNGFIDCKVYIIVFGSDDPQGTQSNTNVFTLDIDALVDPARTISAFSSPRMMATVVLAEKGPNSSSDVMPSQQHYRSAAEWEAYRQNLAPIKRNTRPHLARTNGDIDFFDIRGGHLFMDSNFVALDPSTAIRDMKFRNQTEAS